VRHRAARHGIAARDWRHGHDSLTTTERRLAAVLLVVAPLAGFLGGLLTQDYGGEMSQ
jgi:hypothetical protein